MPNVSDNERELEARVWIVASFEDGPHGHLFRDGLGQRLGQCLLLQRFNSGDESRDFFGGLSEGVWDCVSRWIGWRGYDGREHSVEQPFGSSARGIRR